MKTNKLPKLNVDNSIFKPVLEPLYLTNSSFAYDILEFKYTKETSSYELKSLYYEGIRKHLRNAGFLKRYISKNKSVIILKQGCFIEEVSVEQVKDVFQDYVLNINKPYQFVYNSDKDENSDKNKYSIPTETIRNCYLKQSHNFFNEKWLEHLDIDETPLLKDTKKKAHFVFKNCLVTVSSRDGIEVEDISKLNDFVVWKNQYIDRDFKYIKDNKHNEFAKFVHNVTAGIPKRYEALCSSIGYLSHHYFNPSKGVSIMFYDEALTDPNSPMGGTGKGLIANALKQMRNIAKVDGKLLSATNRFKFELVRPSTQIVWIDDPKKDFEFETLFSCLTDGWTVERKYLPQFFIEPEDSPKVLICSNVVLNRKGTSNKRRQFIVELNDFYSSKFITGTESPIEDEHGILFKESWLDDDWNTFYSFMLDNIELYLNEGLVPYNTKNVETNHLIQSTNEDFVEFMSEKNYKLDEWYDTKEAFDDFIKTYYGEDSKFKQRGFTNWLKLYATSIKAEYDNSSSGGITKFIFITPPN